MSQPDGGPAFPQVQAVPTDLWKTNQIAAVFTGLSLRDWFAGMAMQPLATEYFRFNGACFDKDHLYANLSAHAYRMADAMLKQREAQP